MSRSNNDQQKQQGSFLSRLFGGADATQQTPEAPAENENEGPTLADVHKQVKRMAKEIYKSNALAEDAIQKNEDTLGVLRSQLAEQADAIAENDNSRLELATALLPVVDAIEAGMTTGMEQVETLRDFSPAAARTLEGWLNGQRLLRERVLRLLADENIQPMQPIGELFDPYRHVAVKTVQQIDQPPDTVVGLERAGYLHGDAVLRFSEVVVNQNMTHATSTTETTLEPETTEKEREQTP